MNDEKPFKSTLETIIEGLTTPASQTLPETTAFFNRLGQELLRGNAEHTERLKRIRKEIASGCRRAKGDIV